ncbi:D-alanine--poly(phosphoribitol) ligase [Streptomyces durmitorensis]|uniref:Amino acid adenylation domain-containing protein n=1 Tax=Streptomyces durmitorensis TaxID=319947 RepID=A0ABY4PLX4_9ACTN|nr:amino acid adenylation domain-containing protein [Streptomyces durmitorensis]UQT54803.1 amino acid adenylation domain-containing protein [Streptomyces durmitorensis]
MKETLYEWFAASAAAYPHEPALEVGTDRLTYEQLDAQAQHLAAELVVAHGGVPSRVGLLAERSVLAYAGYLAVQRIGATVVPLNPAFPAARTEAVVRAGRLDLVLAQEQEAAAHLSVPVLAPDHSDLRGAALPELPPWRAEPDGIAYVLFTSGSTGTPKGVPVRHSNVCAYLAHVVERYEVRPGSRVSQTFDLTFDLSVFDMFTAWGGGGTLVVPDRKDLMAPVRWVADQRLTHWFSVPSMVSYASRMRSLGPGRMPSLRWSLFCGEPLTVQQARAWSGAAPDSTLENLYGPTELTISCAQFRLPDDPGAWPVTGNGTVPVGELYPGLEQLILDEGGHPAEQGELVVRGAQRFPGYLDPADNVGRFMCDGPAGPSGRRIYEGHGPLTDQHWYRTGDRVLRDGSACGLVHLGRLDQQVKVRGYRVELGEIEAVLRGRPGVVDAVVVAVEGPAGETVLEAVCTGSGLEAADLAGALRARLPAYMVPRGIAVFAELPLNANGKIDRKAVSATLAGRHV